MNAMAAVHTRRSPVPRTGRTPVRSQAIRLWALVVLGCAGATSMDERPLTAQDSTGPAATGVASAPEAESPDPAAPPLPLEDPVDSATPSETEAPAEAPPVDPSIIRLIEELAHPEFEIRQRASEQLIARGDAAIGILEAASSLDDESAVRAVDVLERLFVGESARPLDQRWVLGAAGPSLEVMMQIRRMGDFEGGPQAQAAEAALERVARQPGRAGRAAAAVLDRHALLREDRAIQQLRRHGARVAFGEPLLLQRILAAAAAGAPVGDDEVFFGMDDEAPGEAPETLVGTPEAPQRLSVQHIYLLPKWNGGVEKLQLLTRLAGRSGLTIYVIDGSGVAAEDVRRFEAELPNLHVEPRSAAVLGITWQSFDTTACVIAEVTPGGSADRAGLQGGDVVIAVNGAPVSTFQTLVESLRQHGPGDTIALTILHGAFRERTVDVELDGWESMPDFLQRRYR